MDLIDRQAAIDAVESAKTARTPDGEIYVAKLNAEMNIQILPSAQPERPKGKWIPHSEKSREYIGTALVNVEYDYWFCDTCGYRVENGQPIHNFCPHCGAKMGGDAE